MHLLKSQSVFFTWSQTEEKIVLKGWQVKQSGVYAIRLIYNNRQPTIDSGVTNAVKQVIVLDKDDQEAGRGIIQIPNVADQQGAHPLRNSSEIRIPLVAGPYSLILEDCFNIRRLLII